jgi:hypothetical protein
MVGFEHIFAWCCAFSLVFSPEYIWRSLEIAKDSGFVICSLSCITSSVGLILILHSLWWQFSYYRGVRERAKERAEASRRHIADISIKQLQAIQENSDDDSVDDQHEIRR